MSDLKFSVERVQLLTLSSKSVPLRELHYLASHIVT